MSYLAQKKLSKKAKKEKPPVKLEPRANLTLAFFASVFMNVRSDPPRGTSSGLKKRFSAMTRKFIFEMWLRATQNNSLFHCQELYNNDEESDEEEEEDDEEDDENDD